jgi:hypothetical protein
VKCEYGAVGGRHFERKKFSENLFSAILFTTNPYLLQRLGLSAAKMKEIFLFVIKTESFSLLSKWYVPLF